VLQIQAAEKVFLVSAKEERAPVFTESVMADLACTANPQAAEE
jgi:hypothetical protein